MMQHRSFSLIAADVVDSISDLPEGKLVHHKNIDTQEPHSPSLLDESKGLAVSLHHYECGSYQDSNSLRSAVIVTPASAHDGTCPAPRKNGGPKFPHLGGSRDEEDGPFSSPSLRPKNKQAALPSLVGDGGTILPFTCAKSYKSLSPTEKGTPRNFGIQQLHQFSKADLPSPRAEDGASILRSIRNSTLDAYAVSWLYETPPLLRYEKNHPSLCLSKGFDDEIVHGVPTEKFYGVTCREVGPLVQQRRGLPRSLSHPEDSENLNKLHSFVRSDITELFEVTHEGKSDDESYDAACTEIGGFNKSPEINSSQRVSSSSCTNAVTNEEQGPSTKRWKTVVNSPSSRHFPGRVGIRCVYCAHVSDRRKRAQQASYFPPSVDRIYRMTCTWQRVHFKVCPFVPAEMRAQYDSLKAADTSRGEFFIITVKAVRM